MEILTSMEVRWFFDHSKGTSARAARAWFDGTPDEGERVDRYLVTDRNDIGFKARAEAGEPEKVETKYLVGSLGPTRIFDGVVGEIERWRKLSLELVDPKLEQNGTWIRVAKRRRLRKYRDDENGDIVQVPDPKSERPAAGCGVELTELVIDGEALALTFGLEAFGPEQALLDILLRTSKAVFASTGGLRLDARQSESYAQWVLRMASARRKQGR